MHGEPVMTLSNLVAIVMTSQTNKQAVVTGNTLDLTTCVRVLMLWETVTTPV